MITDLGSKSKRDYVGIDHLNIIYGWYVCFHVICLALQLLNISEVYLQLISTKIITSYLYYKFWFNINFEFIPKLFTQ